MSTHLYERSISLYVRCQRLVGMFPHDTVPHCFSTTKYLLTLFSDSSLTLLWLFSDSSHNCCCKSEVWLLNFLPIGKPCIDGPFSIALLALPVYWMANGYKLGTSSPNRYGTSHWPALSLALVAQLGTCARSSNWSSSIWRCSSRAWQMVSWDEKKWPTKTAVHWTNG